MSMGSEEQKQVVALVHYTNAFEELRHQLDSCRDKEMESNMQRCWDTRLHKEAHHSFSTNMQDSWQAYIDAALKQAQRVAMAIQAFVCPLEELSKEDVATFSTIHRRMLDMAKHTIQKLNTFQTQLSILVDDATKCMEQPVLDLGMQAHMDFENLLLACPPQTEHVRVESVGWDVCDRHIHIRVLNRSIEPLDDTQEQLVRALQKLIVPHGYAYEIEVISQPMTFVLF